MSKLFNLLPFETKDGVEHYSYRYWIAFGIVLNSIATYLAEKFIVNVITRKADQRLKDKKEAEF